MLKPLQQLRQLVIKLIHSPGIRPDMHQEDKAVESRAMSLFKSFNGTEYYFGGAVVLFRRMRIIGMAEGTRRIINELEPGFFCPGSNRVVVPFKRRQKERGILLCNAQAL